MPGQIELFCAGLPDLTFPVTLVIDKKNFKFVNNLSIFFLFANIIGFDWVLQCYSRGSCQWSGQSQETV